MKNIFLSLYFFSIVFCVNKPPEEISPIVINKAYALDKVRMEQILLLMPTILNKSAQFQRLSISQRLADDEFNKRFYEYLFEEQAFADRLGQAGFENATAYEQFYNEMIDIYLLLLENPDVLATASSRLPELEKESSRLVLRQAQEPNNKDLSDRLEIVNYELINYQNIILVGGFLDQLNSMNES